jgi:hypothetical protein
MLPILSFWLLVCVCVSNGFVVRQAQPWRLSMPLHSDVSAGADVSTADAVAVGAVADGGAVGAAGGGGIATNDEVLESLLAEIVSKRSTPELVDRLEGLVVKHPGLELDIRLYRGRCMII